MSAVESLTVAASIVSAAIALSFEGK